MTNRDGDARQGAALDAEARFLGLWYHGDDASEQPESDADDDSRAAAVAALSPTPEPERPAAGSGELTPAATASADSMPLTRRELRARRRAEEAAALADAVLFQPPVDDVADPEAADLVPPARPAVADPAQPGDTAVSASGDPATSGPGGAASPSRAAAKRGSANRADDASPARRPRRSRPANRGFRSRALTTSAILLGLAVGVVVVVPGLTGLGDSELDPAALASTDANVLQSLQTADDLQFGAAERSQWGVLSRAEVLRERWASGNTSGFSYSVGSAGEVRWPFPNVVPISSGFGPRAAPCFGCSSYHLGIDFLPGDGTPIYVVADGVVSSSEALAWGLGSYVTIDHQIGGQTVSTVYAHLQRDSTPLRVGDVVAAGDYLGLVGRTGTATASHLHFEVHVGGVPVDPFVWLQTNVG